MFETGRRSATSTSELGLYSDRSDHYHRNRYGFGVRKYVIGVMVVLAIILVSVLLYDFTSSTTVINHGGKELKHVYILQNALKRPVSPFQKTSTTTSPSNSKSNRSEILGMEDRSDRRYDEDDDIGDSGELEDQSTSETHSIIMAKSNPEFRNQNMDNFNMRKRLLSMNEDESEEKVQGKQLFGNHAMVYRLRQRYKHPVPDEDTSFEETRPVPFHFEYKTPIPSSFKRPRYPQLSQYRYPQSSNNIQDIIKYLTKDKENQNRGIKFSGVYVNPTKFDFYPEVGETMSNSDRSEEENPAPYSFSLHSDPLYQYKPKNPSDVNLLATSNLRFSPSVFHKHNPGYSDPYYQRPPSHFNTQLSSPSESHYDNYGSHTTSNSGKKRKPKPFSVMLDIYPIPDTVDLNRKSSRPRFGPSNQQNQGPPEEYETRRPISHNKASKHSLFPPPPQPISLVAVPEPQSNLDDEERQQMIFHLNLYPRKRNRMNRNNIIPRSERTDHSIEEHMEEKASAPLDNIVKHLADHSAIQVSEFEETQLSDEADISSVENLGKTRYEESELGTKNQEKILNEGKDLMQDLGQSLGPIPPNHKPELIAENITEKYLNVSNENIEGVCKNCETVKLVHADPKPDEMEKTVKNKDIDTVEGFEDFADGLLATD